MPIVRPYYRLHQIISGQYALHGELVTQDGVDYEGPYHVLPNGNIFSEYRPVDASIQLFYKRMDVDPQSREYNRVKGNPQKVSQYTAPKFYTCTPTERDYKEGFVYRYFAQKRNNPSSTIIEISYEDFTRANLRNAPGISLQLYALTSLKWLISRVSPQDAEKLNKKETQTVALKFIGLGTYLSNYLEFYQDKVA